MSTIYSLPLTNVLVNGSKTYRIRTRDYDQILQHVEVSSKTNETINLNFEDLYFESIAFKDGSDLGETTLKCIRNTIGVKNYMIVGGRPITCSDELKDVYLAELQFLVSRGYSIDVPVPHPLPVSLDGPDTITSPGRYEYRVIYEPAEVDPEYFRDWFLFGAYVEDTQFDTESDPDNPTIFYVIIPDDCEGNINLYVRAQYGEWDWVDKYTNVNIEPQPIFKDVTLDLNNAWRRSQNYQSPLEGWTLYESASNWHVGGASAICYLNIVSNDAPLVMYYCSYAEAQFDWLNIGFPDGTGVDTLRSWQEPPTSIDTMGLVEKSADMTGVCTITYYKDDVIDRFDDRGYILIPNDIRFINEYEEEPPVPEPIHIQNITISGPNQITTPGTYDYYASITPSAADEYDIDWDTIGFTDPHWYLQTDPEDPFHAQIVIPETESFGSAFYLRCEDNVSFNYDRFSISIDIYIEPPVPADGPLCFTAHSSDVVVTIPLAVLTNPMISTDGVNWSTAPATYTIPANESVYMKADSCNSISATNKSFDFSETVDASGNIMSLTGDINKLNMTGNSFYSLFRNCGLLKTAPKLPAMTLTTECYYGMFNGCTSLTTAPELPAMTLTTECYYDMFGGCTSLTTAPELPATELADSCYHYMFRNCSSLTQAPELPATELADSCYTAMFVGCSKLTTAPELPATTLTSSCYQAMFQNCSSLTTAPELPATTLTTKCYNSMFQNCSSLTTAPELPATTLVSNCYNNMFYNCNKLNYIKVGATEWRTSYTSNWVYGVSSTGTFYKKTGVNISVGVNGIPSGWTVVEY